MHYKSVKVIFMPEKQIARQYFLKNNGTFSIKYGTTIKNNPTVIYLRAKGKVKPYIDKTNYKSDVSKIKKGITNIIKEELMSLSDIIDISKYLFDIDLTEDTMNYNKISRLNYNIYLCPINVGKIEDYEKRITDMCDRIEIKITGCVNKNNLSIV